jgi:hypothetical protein
MVMVDPDIFPSVVTGRYASSRRSKCSGAGVLFDGESVARLRWITALTPTRPPHLARVGPAECSPRVFQIAKNVRSRITYVTAFPQRYFD